MKKPYIQFQRELSAILKGIASDFEAQEVKNIPLLVEKWSEPYGKAYEGQTGSKKVLTKACTYRAITVYASPGAWEKWNSELMESEEKLRAEGKSLQEIANILYISKTKVEDLHAKASNKVFSKKIPPKPITMDDLRALRESLKEGTRMKIKVERDYYDDEGYKHTTRNDAVVTIKHLYPNFAETDYGDLKYIDILRGKAE